MPSFEDPQEGSKILIEAKSTRAPLSLTSRATESLVNFCAVALFGEACKQTPASRENDSKFLKKNENRPRWAYARDRTQRRIVTALCTGAKRHRKRQEGKGRNVCMDARRRDRGLVRDPLSDLGFSTSNPSMNPKGAFRGKPWITEIVNVCNIFNSRRNEKARESRGKGKGGKEKEDSAEGKRRRISIFGFRESGRIVFRVALYIYIYTYTLCYF